MVPAAVGRALARGAAWWPGAVRASRTNTSLFLFLFFFFSSVLMTHISYGLLSYGPTYGPAAGPQAGPPTGAGTMVLTVPTVPGRN
jgi:hypothetical protein